MLHGILHAALTEHSRVSLVNALEAVRGQGDAKRWRCHSWHIASVVEVLEGLLGAEVDLHEPLEVDRLDVELAGLRHVYVFDAKLIRMMSMFSVTEVIPCADEEIVVLGQERSVASTENVQHRFDALRLRVVEARHGNDLVAKNALLFLPLGGEVSWARGRLHASLCDCVVEPVDSH